MRIVRPIAVISASVSAVALVAVVSASPASAAAIGSLDKSWASNGKLVFAFNPGGDDEAAAIARQADGNLVIAGKAYNGTTYPHMALARVTATGQLDTSFGGTGQVVVPFFAPGPGVGTNGDEAHAVAIQGDGKILIAGSASDAAGDGAFAVARYLPNGTLDPTFGANGAGQVSVPVGPSGFDDAVNGIALQADGSIVLAGSWSGGWGVVRLTGGGALDTTFNAAGAVPGIQSFSLGDALADNAYAVAIQTLSQFKFDIVVSGSGAHTPGTDGAFNEDFALVRLTSSGIFDTTFGGGDGIVEWNAGSQSDAATSLAVQSDDSIVVAGVGTNAELTVARFGKSGALDTTFGTSGKTVIALAGDAGVLQTGLVLQADGSILAAGTEDAGHSDDVLVARLTSAGALDSAFGTGGTTTTNVGAFGSADSTGAVALDAVGRLVVVGSTRDSAGVSQWFATRYITGAAPTVVTNPSMATSCGTAVSYTVVASGPTPIQYSWQVQGSSGGSWITLSDSPYITGTATPTITIQPATIFPGDNGDHLRVVLTNAGGSVTSSAAVLRVGTAPSVVTNPVDTSPSGDGVVTFSAAASGSPSTSVQWYVKPVGGTFSLIPGATSTNYTFLSTGSDFGNQYRAKFTDFCGSATTTAAKLVPPAP